MSHFERSLVDRATPCVFLIDPNRTHVDSPIIASSPSVNKTKPTGTISMPPKVYRPHLPSNYIKPDLAPDVLDGMELLYKEHGKSLCKKKLKLPPQDPDDTIHFDPKNHQQELDKNLVWGDCPEQYRPRILELVKEYWDVFCKDGLRKHIRGYEFRIDTGDIAPICCKIPRYGPHESKVIISLCDRLEDNGLIEDDDGPWGALVVLAAKPNQENIPWHQYVWRLCVLYRRLNQVT